MNQTKQILDAIFANSGYSLDDYLADLGITVENQPATLRQRLLTTKQTCEYLQVSVTTLWRLTKRGELTPVRVGGRAQFDVKDLDRFIRRQARGRRS